MIAYFDTSAIVPLLIEEPGTAHCRQQWVAADRLVTVRLAHVEVRAALAQAVRTSRITARQRRGFVRDLDDLLAQAALVDVDDELIWNAGTLAEAHALRAYDAVHLAAALTVASDDLALVAGDRVLLAAAAEAGLATAAVSRSENGV